MACTDDYTRTLFRVAHDLTEEDIQSLKFVCMAGKWDIPKPEIEKVSSGMEFILLLQKNDIIKKGCLGELKTIVWSIKRKDLHIYLQDYDRKEKRITAARANVRLGAVPNFIETKQCTEVLECLQTNRLVILRGMSGSGKTQMSYWCVERFSEKNAESLVWKVSCEDENDLLMSLSEILEFLQMKFESKSEDKYTFIIEMVNVIIDVLAHEEWKGNTHLFLFDDIRKSCSEVVAAIFCKFRKTTNVKVIASTESSLFYEQFKTADQERFVAVKGLSGDDVQKFFESFEDFRGCEEDLARLARSIGCLPYGLILARAYIVSTGMTVREYTDKLNQQNFLESVEKALGAKENRSYDKGLVRAQMLTLDEVEHKLSTVGKTLLRYIPFLDNDSIPYTLLRSLATNIGDSSDLDVDIRNLIKKLRDYSIGQFIGTGDNTVISIHAVTTLVLWLRLKREERTEIVPALLHFFSRNLTLDCRLRSSVSDNLLLQYHAECVLIKAESVLDTNLKDMQLLQCIIRTAIGVTFRVSGADHVLADEYLMKARTQMFELIEESPEKFRLEVDEKGSPTTQSDDTVAKESMWQASAAFIVRTLMKSLPSSAAGDTSGGKDGIEARNASNIDQLYGKLVGIPKALPECFIFQLVLNMRRSTIDMQHLLKVGNQQESGISKSVGNCLKQELYQKLKSEKGAMPVEQIHKIFAVELMIIILYNNGRNHYQWKLNCRESSVDFCCNELRISSTLGKLLKRDFPDYPSVQYLITQRNGLPYQIFTDKRFTQGKEASSVRSDLKDAVYGLKTLLDQDARYFEFGILKVSKHQNMHHGGKCLKLLLKWHTQLYSICSDEKEREEQYVIGKQYADKLVEIAERMSDWTAVPGFHVQIARFLKLKPTKENLTCALDHFKKADDLEKKHDVIGPSHFQLQARFGQITCYKLLRDHESLVKAQDQCQDLISCLHKTNLFNTFDKAQRNLSEIQRILKSLSEETN